MFLHFSIIALFSDHPEIVCLFFIPVQDAQDLQNTIPSNSFGFVKSRLWYCKFTVCFNLVVCDNKKCKFHQEKKSNFNKPVAFNWIVVYLGQSVPSSHHYLVKLWVPQAADDTLHKDKRNITQSVCEKSVWMGERLKCKISWGSSGFDKGLYKFKPFNKCIFLQWSKITLNGHVFKTTHCRQWMF